jgi:hypothetical protein
MKRNRQLSTQGKEHYNAFVIKQKLNQETCKKQEHILLQLLWDTDINELNLATFLWVFNQ